MDARRILKDIKSLKIQGAKNVALAGLKALLFYSENDKSGGVDRFIESMSSKSELICRTRPTEPELRNAISFVMIRAKGSKNTEEAKRAVRKGVMNFSRNIENTIREIGVIGSRRVAGNSVIFTHCHSNTVMEILRAAKSAGKKFEVICTETRPLNQGLLTARQLAGMGIPVTLVVDSAARAMMKKCDIVLLGADAITSTGDVVNKIGSSTIALIADEQGKPLYVAAGIHKIDPQTAKGFMESIEERPAKEVAKKIKGVKIRNPAFDIISAKRISGIITEKGIISPAEVAKFLEMPEGF